MIGYKNLLWLMNFRHRRFFMPLKSNPIKLFLPFSYILEGSREYFYAQLDRHFPGLKERYIRTYGNQYEINSPRNADLMALFHRRCEQNGMLHDVGAVFQYLHEFPEEEQSGQISFLPGSM